MGLDGPIRIAAGRVYRKERVRVQSAGSQPATKDSVLVSGIRSGDEHAMAQLYDRYSPVVYSVALRVLGDTGAAEDVLQEVFLQLWRNPVAFDSNRGSLGAWLAVIARNRAIDSLRKRKPETNSEEVVLSVDIDLESETERRRVLEKVRGVINALPEDQRKALEMAFFEGLTHTEIAAKTGQPLGTIKTRIRTGLLSLRKALAA
ncbi:MAG: sigma-70 family RNA polymerase sigma factor [Acidobacteriales bacterium]|nr:sigma-70 family RNA polymerase sigma factor [Terriglobales bacterium]